MGNLDRAFVQRKLRNLATYLDQLESVAALPKNEFLSSPRHYEAERLTELIVNVAIDINLHCLRLLDKVSPVTYRETFLELGKAGILEMSLATKLAKSAGLRNLLVHQYDDVDLDRFYEALAGGIVDYRAYAAAISQYAGL